LQPVIIDVVAGLQTPNAHAPLLSSQNPEQHCPFKVHVLSYKTLQLDAIGGNVTTNIGLQTPNAHAPFLSSQYPEQQSLPVVHVLSSSSLHAAATVPFTWQIPVT